MPTVCHLRPIHGSSNSLLLRMNVALRDVHIAVPSEIRKRPRVHVWRPARQEGVSQKLRRERGAHERQKIALGKLHKHPVMCNVRVVPDPSSLRSMLCNPSCRADLKPRQHSRCKEEMISQAHDYHHAESQNRTTHPQQWGWGCNTPTSGRAQCLVLVASVWRISERSRGKTEAIPHV
jgi:hypothetical protein